VRNCASSRLLHTAQESTPEKTHLGPSNAVISACRRVEFDDSGGRAQGAGVLGMGGMSCGRHIKRPSAGETLKHDRNHVR
jgi:hypothetical protein